MARIRTIKPEFWKHEGLSELPEATHMLAAALLNYADDEGYFNANPALIKAECFPLRELSRSITVGLNDLSNEGYLTLGTATNGRRYGKINQFKEHQVINKPRPSKIKELYIQWEVSCSSTVGLPERCSSTTTGNGMEQGMEQGTGNGINHPTDDSEQAKPDSLPACPHKEILALYAKHLPELRQPVAKLWNGARADTLKTRWREDPERQNLNWWDDYFSYAAEQPFLTGSKGWKADMDWLIKKGNMVKVLEGRYLGDEGDKA